MFAEVRRGRRVPAGFEPFELVGAGEEDVRRVEGELGVELPGQYRAFMTAYGAGQFLFVDLVRVADLVVVNREEAIPGFVVVAPVGTGDWWGFEARDGVCVAAVSMWCHDDRTVVAQNPGFFEFLVDKGLRIDASGMG